MARYRRCDGNYADVECAYAELERYLILSCTKSHYRKKEGHQLGGLSYSRHAEDRVIRAMLKTAPSIANAAHNSKPQDRNRHI
jgi:hypothetical protein